MDLVLLEKVRKQVKPNGFFCMRD